MLSKSILVVYLLVCTLLSKAEDRQGYYVTLKGDTIKTTIKRGGFATNAEAEYLRVTIKDASGKQQTFTPKEITAYGFDYEGDYYHFRSKPTEKGEMRFLQVSFQTPTLRLFYYRKLQSLGYASTEERFYTLENAKGEFLFLNNSGSLKKMKAKAVVFFQNDPQTLSVIQTKFEKKKDLQQDIVEIMPSCICLLPLLTSAPTRKIMNRTQRGEDANMSSSKTDLPCYLYLISKSQLYKFQSSRIPL